MLSFVDRDRHLPPDLLLAFRAERHEQRIPLHGRGDALARHAAVLSEKGGELCFEHFLPDIFRLRARARDEDRFVGQIRLLLPRDGERDKAE